MEFRKLFNLSFCKLIIQLLGFLYLVFGVLKLHGLLFPAQSVKGFLFYTNPIFILPNYYILGFTAICEVLVGAVAINRKVSISCRSGLILWLSTSGMAYKFALAMVNYEGPCGCLLGINHFLPVSMIHQTWISDILMIGMVLSSFCVLLYSVYLQRVFTNGAKDPVE